MTLGGHDISHDSILWFYNVTFLL